MGALRDGSKKGGWPSFAAWLDEIGTPRVAKKLKVHPKTVTNWRYGVSDPRIKHMRAIRKWSRGAITYEMMIDSPSYSRPTYLVVT